MRALASNTCILAGLFSATVAQCVAQPTVSLSITIVKEVVHTPGASWGPAVNEKVYVLPYSGSIAPDFTDADGVVRFRFPATPYVTVYVGDPISGHKFPRMSGQFSQNTSMYLKGGYGAPSGLDTIIEFARDVKESRSNVPLQAEVRKELVRLRDHLRRIGPGDDEHLKRELQEAIELVNDALQPVGKLGVLCQYDRSGALVKEVYDDSAAKTAGIRVGDRIVAVDDLKIGSFVQFISAFARASNGNVTITLVRPGQLEPQMVGARLK